MILNFYEIVFATFFIYCQFSCFKWEKKLTKTIVSDVTHVALQAEVCMK